MKEKNVRRISFTLLFLLMLSAAFVENMRGILVPSFREQLGLSANKISYMLTLGGMGYIFATYTADSLLKRFGAKNVLKLSITLAILSTVTLAYTVNYPMYLLGMLLMNLALGYNSVSANVLIPLMAITMQIFIMNSLHFMYGFGAMFGQRLSGYLITHGTTVKQLYLGVAALYAVLFVFLLLCDYPDEKRQTGRRRILPFLKNPLFILYVIGICSYVFGEQGLATWFTDYIVNIYGLDENVGSHYLSIFFILLGVGRLLGGLFIEKIGRFPSILLGLLLGFLSTLFGILIGPKAFLLISLSGLFYSFVFPTLMVTIGEHFYRERASAISLSLTGGSLGLILYNQLMGFLTDRLGYGFSVYLIPASVILAMVCFYILWKSEPAKDVL